jgi:putative phosphoesterase
VGELRIGVISDTHGYVSPGVDRAFRGVARILHAGDVDSPAVLRRLAAIAPVTAVRGNVDTDGATRALSRAEFVDIGGALVYVCHCAEYLEIDPVAAGVRVIVHGHTHRPELLTRDG